MNIGSSRQQSGEYGGKFINAASGTVTGSFMELRILEATVLGATTSNITSFPASISLVAGTAIPGVWTSIAVTSGSLVAYNRKY